MTYIILALGVVLGMLLAIIASSTPPEVQEEDFLTDVYLPLDPDMDGDITDS